MSNFYSKRFFGFVFACAFLVFGIVLFCFIKERNVLNDMSGCAKVAVIDASKLKNSAVCFQAHKTISDMLNDVISRMKNSESELKTDYDKINQNQKLTAKQRNSQISVIENKWSEISKKYNIEIQKIKDKDLKLSQVLENKLNQVISDLAKTLKINLVLNKETKETLIVFYNSNNIDITDKVIQELNKRLPTSNLQEILDDQ